MDDQVEIDILVKLGEFKFSFDKTRRVEAIKQNEKLIKLVKEKLGLNSEDIQFEFEFNPPYEKNQLISEWSTKQKDPKVKITLKSRSFNTSQFNQVASLEFGILAVMEKAISKQTNKAVDDAVNRVQENMTKEFNEIKKQNKEIANKINNLIGMENLYPLLEYVSKFRLQIVQELINDHKIPPSCSNWNDMYKHLEEKNKTKKEVWRVIDDKAEDLGLNYDDWLILKLKSSEINCYKHPTKMEKDEAYAKIETLKGTYYENCYEPLRNLVSLFDAKKWNY